MQPLTILHPLKDSKNLSFRKMFHMQSFNPFRISLYSSYLGLHLYLDLYLLSQTTVINYEREIHSQNNNCYAKKIH